MFLYTSRRRLVYNILPYQTRGRGSSEITKNISSSCTKNSETK